MFVASAVIVAVCLFHDPLFVLLVSLINIALLASFNVSGVIDQVHLLVCAVTLCDVKSLNQWQKIN